MHPNMGEILRMYKIFYFKKIYLTQKNASKKRKSWWGSTLKKNICAFMYRLNFLQKKVERQVGDKIYAKTSYCALLYGIGTPESNMV